MLSHAIGSPDNCVSVKVWKTRWTWKDVGCRLEKIKAWCCKLHWLQGAVTWQQGDQISKFVRACVLQFACLLVHMLLCGRFKAPFEDTIHFLCDKASQANRCTHLRPDKWSHNCLRYSSVTFHAPTLSLFSCTLFPQGEYLWYESPPSGWRACCSLTRACMSVESSHWISQQMSCKMAPGLYFLLLVRLMEQLVCVIMAALKEEFSWLFYSKPEIKM